MTEMILMMHRNAQQKATLSHVSSPWLEMILMMHVFSSMAGSLGQCLGLATTTLSKRPRCHMCQALGSKSLAIQSAITVRGMFRDVYEDVLGVARPR